MYEQSAQSSYEWLVIALVYNHQYYDELYRATFPNDNTYKSMEDQKNHLFHAFKDIPFHKDIKMLIVEDRLKFAGQPNDFTLSDTLTVSQIVADPDKTDGTNIVPFQLDNITMPETLTNGKQLGDFLKEIVCLCKAKRHIVITYGHGSIVGINLAMRINSLQPLKKIRTTDQLSSDKIAVDEKCYNLKAKHFKQFSSIISEKMNTLLQKGKEVKELIEHNRPFFTKDEFKEILENTKELVILTNKELNQALQIAFDKGKVEVLVMFNCLMQNVYTQYELRNSVRYLVAPITGISYPGYNYRSVFASLQQNLNLPANEIADLFVKTINSDFPPPTYRDKYYKTYKNEIEGTWKVTSVELNQAKLENVRNCFRGFFTKINELSATNQYVFITINYTLIECFNYAHHCLNNSQTMIDLLTFCQYFAQLADRNNSPIKSLVKPARDLAESLQDITRSVFAGEQLYGKEDYFFDINFGEHFGFGFLLQTKIYPMKTIQRAVLSDNDSEYYPTFLKDTGFDEFYKTYSEYN